ncbi:dihydroxyacetone kinase subunit DhaL [Enterococcus casseliflavus]|uniref:dihydroxyacetone kinase subunit DhaL n=1 Tax=Enterococcus casseliflavus TaxID=37734 RepID=UPI0023DB9E20|nr:dihydroxyacetone kinase subunit DhaL [Enterococcus casseliflavus]WEL46822.1 dihydroxyacetone kinase subunit DhaL [Enterococcus casseliflavus]
MFTKENSLKTLRLFHQTIQTEKDYLNALDTAIGDGDHGSNLARGMTAVIETLEKEPVEEVSEVFKKTAMTLISKVGGASGPLYGTAFLEMAKTSAMMENPKAILEAALSGIKRRGQSEAKDKTMVETWERAIVVLEAETLSFEVVKEAAEKTADLVAKKGRASYLGERSLGHIDPGAMSSAFLFGAMIEAGVFDE